MAELQPSEKSSRCGPSWLSAPQRQQELVSEVVKPAEAEAERVRILAVADAEKMKIQAEAAASHNRVALDRMLIDQLPEIVKQAAQGLSGANLTVSAAPRGSARWPPAWWDRVWPPSILCVADSVNTSPAMALTRSDSTRRTRTSPKLRRCGRRFSGLNWGFVGLWVGVFCRRSGQCEGDRGVEEVERTSLGVGGRGEGGHDWSVGVVAQVVSGECGQVCEQALVAAGW